MKILSGTKASNTIILTVNDDENNDDETMMIKTMMMKIMKIMIMMLYAININQTVKTVDEP